MGQRTVESGSSALGLGCMNYSTIFKRKTPLVCKF